MADQIAEGFGSLPPVVLTAGANEIACRFVSSQPQGLVRITTIEVVAVQTLGALVATIYVPVYVLRGGSSLGIGASGGFSASGLRPTSATMVGMPDPLPAGTEILYGGYIRLQNQLALPLKFGAGEIEARNGQRLAVVVGNPVDGTVAPPAATPQCAVMLSVLGVSGMLADPGAQDFPGGRVSRSLPRWDVFGNVPNG